MDTQGSHRISHGLTLIRSILNLNNEVFGFFFGSPQYPHQREYYGRTFTVSVSAFNPAR